MVTSILFRYIFIQRTCRIIVIDMDNGWELNHIFCSDKFHRFTSQLPAWTNPNPILVPRVKIYTVKPRFTANPDLPRMFPYPKLCSKLGFYCNMVYFPLSRQCRLFQFQHALLFNELFYRFLCAKLYDWVFASS